MEFLTKFSPTSVRNKYLDQLRAGYGWLRFSPELEVEYQQYIFDTLCAQRDVSRIILLVSLTLYAVSEYGLAVNGTVGVEMWQVLPARLLGIAAVLLSYFATADASDMRRGYRRIEWVLVSVIVSSLVTMFYYAQAFSHSTLYLPTLGPLMLLLMVIFPIGYSFWRSTLLLLLYLLSFICLIQIFPPRLRLDWMFELPYFILSSALIFSFRYFHEHASRTHFLSANALDTVASYDSLVGLYNRRMFDILLARSLTQVEREDATQVALLMLDVDHFKKYNDGYGHLAGDKVLTKIGEAMSDTVRRRLDFAARVGGEEFALVCHDTTAEYAVELGERLRTHIREKLAIAHAGSDTDSVVTVSIGIALSRSGDTLDSLYQRADQAMYQAKMSGRNRVMVTC